jgi:predicted ATPase
MAEGLVASHQFDEALHAIDGALAQIGERESFDLPEMLRVKGHVLASSGHPSEAEKWLKRARDTSRRQGALGWELRAAITQARLWREVGRAKEARALIAPLYARYQEGLDSLDLVAAKALLDGKNRSARQ